jgi:predicted ATPase/DNA-binding SARP family transcriptional activator
MHSPREQVVDASQIGRLQAQLLGGCDLTCNGRRLAEAAFRRRRALTLLLCLLLAPGHRLPREVVLERLWPEETPATSTVNLYSVLSALRAALGGGPSATAVQSRDSAIALAPELAVDLDVEAFEAAAAVALNSGEPAALRAAAALYGGPLLPDLPYEDWVEGRREALARLQRRVLMALAAAEAASDPATAEERLRTLLAAEPTNEAAARRLLRLLAGSGQRAEALRVYARLRTALREELDLAPSAKTEELHAALRASPAPAQATKQDLPTGTVTFLMTDIEGSTALWEADEGAMRAALAWHDTLIAETLAAHGGHQVKERGEGDSIFAVFASPRQALAAACAMQHALLAEPWPPATPLRARMGLHTGEATLREGGYYGVAVNRAARVRGLGHGGQVLLSAATAALVREAPPTGVGLRALGSHSLRGLAEPEAVYQVLHPALPAEFPPLLSPQAPRHNLPRQTDSFIGREREQGEVLALLGQAALVTLTGTGGVGKTRLALAVAGELLDRYPNGVWLVELAALADPALMARSVATVLGLREEPNRPVLATLTDHVKEKHLLLVLDNCEHLVGACAELVTALLRACPGLQVLTTSREGLAIPGEVLYQVPSLSVPDPMAPPPVELVPAYEAVRLFAERAQARRQGFTLTERIAPVVAAVCARLDGIPLAIELAAARVGTLSVEAIAARLDDRFRLLTGGSRVALPRQQTLRATLDWSWDLLGERSRDLLRRLAVFAGGWTLAAAESVCAGESIDVPTVLDLLEDLVNKSLAHLGEGVDGTRYGLLETVRQYGWERLTASGEGAARVRERHLAYFLALAEEAESQLTGPEPGVWLARLEAEHDNLRTALDWSLAGGGQEKGMRLAAALWQFWLQRGHLSEGRRRLEAALTVAADAAACLRARTLLGAGVLAFEQDDYDQARDRSEAALTLYRELEDRRSVASVLGHLGKVAWQEGNVAEATVRFEESLALARELQDWRSAARALGNLGNLAYQASDYLHARARYEECLTIFRQLGDQQGTANAINNLAMVVLEQGDYAQARAWLQENLAWARAHSAPIVIAAALQNLGEVASEQSEYAQARLYYLESLQLLQALGAKVRIALCLEALARLAALRPAPQADDTVFLAARLWGAAEALREAIGAPLPPSERPLIEGTLTTLRATLGEERFAAALAAGRHFPLEQVIAEVLAGA